MILDSDYTLWRQRVAAKSQELYEVVRELYPHAPHIRMGSVARDGIEFRLGEEGAVSVTIELIAAAVPVEAEGEG